MTNEVSESGQEVFGFSGESLLFLSDSPEKQDSNRVAHQKIRLVQVLH
jgi:hypothetical protein